MIAPRVNLTSESYLISIKNRETLTVGHVQIKQNAWIGTNVTIFPGVTIRENSIVAASAVVHQDVPDNTIVGGIPAKINMKID